jgi:hypothetical protein
VIEEDGKRLAAQPVQGHLRQGVPIRWRGNSSNPPRNLIPFSKSRNVVPRKSSGSLCH